MNINSRQYGKRALMTAKIKQWCKDNPGKKALLARTNEPSQMLTYYPGSKAFVYSPVKLPLEPIIAVDEFINNWYKRMFFGRLLTK